MKPVVVLLDGKKRIDPEDLTEAVDNAYREGFNDGYDAAEKEYSKLLSHYIPYGDLKGPDLTSRSCPEAFNYAWPITERSGV